MGLNTNYIDEGVTGGECIVLLHGWGAKISLFAPVISHLSPHFRVISLDLPGFGESEEPHEPWGVSEYVDFVTTFLEQLKVQKANLIGHSLGGRIIIKLMASSKKLDVMKIVLVDSAGVLPQRGKPKMLSMLSPYKIGKAVLSIPLMKKLVPNGLDNLKSKFGSEDYRSASPRMRDCLVKIVNEDLQPYFHCNKVETLIVWGENDDVTPLSDAKIMESLMENSGVAVIKNAGHFSYLEQNDTFNRIMDSFFNIKGA